MTDDVRLTTEPDLVDTRRCLVLVEDRLGHYPEFRAFFERTFDLATIGLAEPGYVTAPSGRTFVFVFVGRSGEPFPAGLEIHALAGALEPLDEEAADRDLRALIRWMIAGIGGAWRISTRPAVSTDCRERPDGPAYPRRFPGWSRFRYPSGPGARQRNMAPIHGLQCPGATNFHFLAGIRNNGGSDGDMGRLVFR